MNAQNVTLVVFSVMISQLGVLIVILVFRCLLATVLSQMQMLINSKMTMLNPSPRHLIQNV